jgi:hypothetical protein
VSSRLRAITVKQPWAWAIARAGKTIENRSRGTAHRGPLAIHAGLAWSGRGADDKRVLAAVRKVTRDDILPSDLSRGAVIAIAELVDSHPDAGCCRPWGESEYSEAGGRVRTVVHHLVLEDIRPLPEALPCRGALGLWWLPEDVVADLLVSSAHSNPPERTDG